MFRLALPAGAAGQWCRLTVTLPGPAPWWLKVEAADAARGHVVREAFLGRRRGERRALLLHVPSGAGELVLHVITMHAAEMPPVATLAVLSRVDTALRLVAAGWRKLPACLPGDPTGMAWRVRTVLGQAPARAGEAPPYEVWTALHDIWGEAERAALAGGAEADIEIVVVGAPSAAARSVESASRQWRPPRRISQVASLPGFSRMPGAWLVVLQAGDVLADHATACFAHAIRSAPATPGFFADLDCMVAGRRSAPLFKPKADPWLARGTLLEQGGVALHPDTLPGGDAADFGRVPFILTHVQAVRRHAAPEMPAATARGPHVSIIIPTSGRAPHVLRCLRGLLARTGYADFEVLLAVSSMDPADSRQRRTLRKAAALPRVTVLDLQMKAFNYACVNNEAARQARGDLLLLLNDDVMPIRAGWLARMVQLTQDGPMRPADIVGARLLYGHGRVQHGGVIMGLAHLCEHAFRLSARRDGGPYGLALAERQVSAVTAACLLVRRDLWRRIGGMDERFAIALNDVDFCLRAGRADAAVVIAATVELHHYEGRSLGRHYRGGRAGLEALEVQQLRTRWQSVIADDPFYNPSASLEPGREFQPAFPPRLTPLGWIRGDDAAPI